MRSIANFTKTQCSEKHLLVYVESITLMLLDVMADENFQHEKLIELHASIMANSKRAAPATMPTSVPEGAWEKGGKAKVSR